MRNVVVTGASRGIGLAIARKLQEAGWRVIGIARQNSPALAEAQVEFRAADLADIGALRDLVRDLRRTFGPIWGLVNNAAIGTSGILATMRDDAIQQLVQINTVSPLILSKYVVRGMLAEGGGGRIVNIASVAALTGSAGLAPYGATKAALVGWTRSLAREIGAAGITVNAVAPGFMDTAMTEALDAEQRRRVIRRSALHRLATADDVAETVAFLMSDKAKNITGTVVTVDAGNTA